MNSLDRRLALAWRGEDHRLSLPVRIDEHGDEILALLGGRLVEGEGSEVGEVETAQRLGDVVLDDPPQPLVGDADDPGHRQHWHRPHQGHIAACSNKRVKPLPSRAHGTLTRFTPCSGQSVRGTRAVIRQ